MNKYNLSTKLANLLGLVCPVALTVLLVTSAYAQHALIY